MKKYNRYTIKEYSPYLDLHKGYLTRIYPWSMETLNKAQKENKLILITIGYRACKWSKRMVSSCFENNIEIAELLNSKFINILIDKDEHPDVDQYYSKAIRLLCENSGWPLSFFTLPDGSPIFGAINMQPNLLVTIAEGLQKEYEENPQNVEKVSKDLKKNIKLTKVQQKEAPHAFSVKDIRLILEPWKRKFDLLNGGTTLPPKFPLPCGEEFLLESSYYLNDHELFRHVDLTLTMMAKGGIYDQLSSGFFRYTTDVAWKDPYMEKTAADNFQLISLYSKFILQPNSKHYKQIIKDTTSFVINELLSEQGGFYVSILADDDESSTSYYKWSKLEFEEILQDNAPFAADFFGIPSDTSPEEKHTLCQPEEHKKLAAKYMLTEKAFEKKVETIKKQLKENLTYRLHPGTDEMILLSTNALAIKAFTNAYRTTKEKKYVSYALKTASVIKQHFINEDTSELCHYIQYGIKGIHAFLDGYASTIEAFLRLFSLTGDKKWLDTAVRLTSFTIEHFYDGKSGMFLYLPKYSKPNFTQSMPVSDGAQPSSGSIMANALSILSVLLSSETYKQLALQMLYNMHKQLAGSGPFAANWARVIFHHAFDQYFIFVVGEQKEKLHLSLNIGYRPDIFFFLLNKLTDLPLTSKINKNEENTTAYIYKNEEYIASTTSTDELLAFVNSTRISQILP